MDIEEPNEVDHNLETVRVLHQTVVSLRAALEQSKNELHELRERVKTEVSAKSLNRTVECLSVENHVLRQKIIDDQVSVMDDSDDTCDNRTDDGNNESDVDDVFEDETPEMNGIEEAKKDESKDIPKFSKGDSEESEEVDDIELIFTTDDTKELTLQEDLVSIAESDNWKHKFDEKFLQNLKQTWSHSVLVETDISKCGVIDENEPPTQYARRNTLPTPVPYKPIIHREVLGGSRIISSDPKPGVKFFVKSPKTVRPILAEKNIDKQECETQTDITALPVQWRSESFLAHNKGNQNFTTLPSKFQVPFGQLRKQSLRLSEKTQEARRVLLSDINFTSMVPELSRSADHLCNEASSLLCKYPRAFSYMKNPDMAYPGTKSGWSPCECGGLRRPSWDYGGSSYSITPSEIADVTRRRHSMRPSLLSLDASWNGGHPQRPVWASMPSSPTHSHKSRSVPLSCSYIQRFNHHSDVNCYNSSRHYRPRLQNRNKVKFLDSKLTRYHPGRSLPDLRADTIDSNEDSTDSLIDESETYLRRSIDSILTGEDPVLVRKNRHPRSHSQPERIHSNGFGPGKRTQPFLARTPSDIRINHWVKVISTDGKLVVGKVKYIGPLPGSLETFVGLVLPPGEGGNCTGTYAGTRYFVCDSDCGLFVPFKKVVMVWSG